ncbi:hypothetical protein ACFS3C_10305 [Azotobacter vinelandii]
MGSTGPTGHGRSGVRLGETRYRFSARLPANRRTLVPSLAQRPPGFPRVYYLKYHGYAAYFPLYALARYRHLLNRSREQR